MDEKKPAEVLDISQMAGKFKNRTELQAYATQLFHALKVSVEKLQRLEEENQHLKQMLSASVPQLNSVKLIIPDEQAIAEIQLQRLKEAAMSRDLTLDETKRFDLLTKNLYITKGKPKDDNKPKDIEAEVSDAELIQIARNDE